MLHWLSRELANGALPPDKVILLVGVTVSNFEDAVIVITADPPLLA